MDAAWAVVSEEDHEHRTGEQQEHGNDQHADHERDQTHPAADGRPERPGDILLRLLPWSFVTQLRLAFSDAVLRGVSVRQNPCQKLSDVNRGLCVPKL